MAKNDTDERRRAREARKQWLAIANFVALVESHISSLDEEMRQPSNVERGRRIGGLLNTLEMGKDMLKHFTLGMELGKPARSQLKPKRTQTETVPVVKIEPGPSPLESEPDEPRPPMRIYRCRHGHERKASVIASHVMCTVCYEPAQVVRPWPC